MKIIEKKCPNCHANLEFKVGEKDVVCPSCRRTYAIEYDHEISDEVMLKAKDIQLKILKDFETGRKFSKFFFAFVFILMAVIMGFGIFMFISNHNQIQKDRAKMEEESQQFEEEYQKTKDLIDSQREKVLGE